MRISDWSSDVCSSDLALNIIPHGNIYTDDADVAGAVRDRAKAAVDFYWIDDAGRHHAPNTGLILYPKYPEVRMSGFLSGCRAAPAQIMRVRDEGRVLILGMTSQGEVLGYVATADDPVTAERSEEHTSELPSLMRISYAVFCLKKHN